MSKFKSLNILLTILGSFLSGCALLPQTPGSDDIGLESKAFTKKFGNFVRFVDSGEYGYGLVKEKLCVFKDNKLLSVDELYPTDAQYLVQYDGYFDSGQSFGEKAAIVHVGEGASEAICSQKNPVIMCETFLSLKASKQSTT